jgi:hypothetical protein
MGLQGGFHETRFALNSQVKNGIAPLNVLLARVK